MEAFVRLIYAIRDNSYIFIAVIFLYIVMRMFLYYQIEIFFNLIKNVKVREENVFDIKSMTDEERKTFYYTLLNTKLNKDNLDKAEVLSKKCNSVVI